VIHTLGCARSTHLLPAEWTKPRVFLIVLTLLCEPHFDAGRTPLSARGGNASAPGTPGNSHKLVSLTRSCRLSLCVSLSPPLPPGAHLIVASY